MRAAPSCLEMGSSHGPDALGAPIPGSAGTVEDEARGGKGAAWSDLRCHGNRKGDWPGSLPQSDAVSLSPAFPVCPAGCGSGAENTVRGAVGWGETQPRRCQGHPALGTDSLTLSRSQPGARLGTTWDWPVTLWGALDTRTGAGELVARLGGCPAGSTGLGRRRGRRGPISVPICSDPRCVPPYTCLPKVPPP